jgi:hypothetical protein
VGKDDKADNKSNTVTTAVTEKGGTILTNNITLNAKGVKVNKATLLLPDDSRVSDDNMVNLNEKIRLFLYVESGWTEKNGKVFIGASEKIITDSGEKIVDAQDLFSDASAIGIDPADAKEINLSAIITEEMATIKYYIVSYRVWDKNSDAEITGEYKFYIKH